MSVPLLLTDRAYQDIDSICYWWSTNRSADQANRWYRKLCRTMDLIHSQPQRFAVSAESSQLPIEVRQANFGAREKPTHRVVFTIRPDMILVLRIRHHAQDQLTAEDL